jgi:NodT family efflux transporter outer membrane factor (OMF) lipoprotein
MKLSLNVKGARGFLKKIAAAALFIVILPIFSYAALADDSEPASADFNVDTEDWAAMSAKYPNPYASPDLAGLNGLSAGQSPESFAGWWNVLEDDTLTQLISWSLHNNRNMAAARSKIMESRASLGISRAALLPWLDSVNSWTRTESSENSVNAGQTAEISRLGIDSSWEIDIFGGRHQDISAGAASLEADYAALNDAWVTLSAEVAINYVSLRVLQERLHITERSSAMQAETLELLQSRYDAGLIDSLALDQARYTLEQTKAGIPSIKANIGQTMNALSLLVGALPGSMENMLSGRKPMPRVDGVNLSGIPADILRRRPDIRAAELRITAQEARKKSAEADLLPKFYLLGSIGLESLSGGSLFSSDSFGLSFGPKITLPIFHGSAIKNNINVQAERKEQLTASYEQTVLGAVAEVRNALASDTQEKERNKSIERGIDAARNALDVANDKYKNGLTDFVSVIDAQRALLSLEEQFVISEGQMVTNIIQIFKALGGRWAPPAGENPREPDETAE